MHESGKPVKQIVAKFLQRWRTAKNVPNLGDNKGLLCGRWGSGRRKGRRRQIDAQNESKSDEMNSIVCRHHEAVSRAGEFELVVPTASLKYFKFGYWRANWIRKILFWNGF